jgi:hypothetical protein
MKNLYFLFLLCPLFIQTQAVVNSSVYPTDGLQVDIIGHCSSNTDPLPDVIGANVTWDYSDLMGCDEEWLLTFADATDGEIADQLPLANKYFDFSGLAEFYNIVSDTTWALNGLGFGSNLFPYGTEVYLLKFPATLGDSWTNEYSVTDNSDSTHTIISTFTIDGSGTLILPNATYENVIRVHGVEHDPNNNPYNPVFTDEVYYYYSSEYQYHLFHMLVNDECQYQPNPHSISTATFDQSVILEPIVAPNPAANPLDLSITLDIQNEVDLYLYNSMGQLVYSKSGVQNYGGNYRLNYDQELDKGLYLLHIFDGTKQYNTKLIVNN